MALPSKHCRTRAGLSVVALFLGLAAWTFSLAAQTAGAPSFGTTLRGPLASGVF